MAKLILKSPYIKNGGKAGGYLKYIGTREGVELLPVSGYLEYMGKRPRSHGLFGDEDNVDLDKAMEEVVNCPGNIWTLIISLLRYILVGSPASSWASFHLMPKLQ